MKNRALFACAAWLGVALSASAQLTAPTPQPVVGARQPALSPDGKRLAFVYRGDVWVAPSEGGRATALTSHVEADAYPVFSPDGKYGYVCSSFNPETVVVEVASHQIVGRVRQDSPTRIDASQTKLELGDVRIQCGEDARERAWKELVVRVEKEQKRGAGLGQSVEAGRPLTSVRDPERRNAGLLDH
mgnify:CR=1 FL=1